VTTGSSMDTSGCTHLSIKPKDGKGLKLLTADDAQPIVKLIKDNPNCTHVELSGNSLGVEAIRAISEAFQPNTTLVEANFSDIFTGKLRSEIPPSVELLVQALRNKPQLAILNFSDNAFGPDGVKAFIDFMAGNTFVKTLNINNTGLGPAGGQLVAAGLRGFVVGHEEKEAKRAKPCCLEVLIAGRSRLEDPGASAMALAIQEMTTLKTIKMVTSNITHIGIIALAQAFEHNPDLEEIDLEDNNIGKKGAPSIIRSLDKLPKLRKVNFGDCLIPSDSSAQIVKKLKTRTTLEELNLCFSELKDFVVPDLVELVQNNPNLKKLELNGNHFSSDKVKELKAAMKRLERVDVLGTFSDNESGIICILLFKEIPNVIVT